MALTSEQNRLLDSFRRAPFADLYLRYPKRELLQGLSRAQRGVAPEFFWQGDSALAVRLPGEAEVVFRAENGKGLASTCDCGHRECHHRVATFALVKKILDPSLASLSLPVATVAALRERLDGGRKTSEERFAIELEKAGETLLVRVTDRGEPVEYGYGATNLPPALLPLAVARNWGMAPADSLAALLRRAGQQWPILFRRGDGTTPLRWHAEPHAARVRLDARSEEGVVVQKLVDDRPARPADLPFGPFLIDLEGARLAIFEDPGGWDLFERLRLLLRGETGREVDPDDHRFVAPAAAFEHVFFNVDEEEWEGFAEEVRLAEEGADAAPREAEPLRVRLRVEMAQEGCSLFAEGFAGMRQFSVDPKVFALFTEGFYEHLSAPLRTFKRRPALMEAFFGCARQELKTKKQAAFRAALSGGDFVKRAVRREAKGIIDHLLERAEVSTSVLALRDGAWHLFLRDRDGERRLMEILFRHFGEKAFRGISVPGGARVAQKVLLEQFGPLAEALREGGFELVVDGRPVRSAEIEVEVEAVPSGIDWFEIRPEIRCDGTLLTQEEWLRALSSGLLPLDGSLRLLDAEALKILAEMARIAPSGDPGRRRGAQQVVRVPRLQILDILALRRRGVRVRLPREDEEILESLLAFETLPERPLPPTLHCTLRPYQHRGYDWLSFLYTHKFGACLADDMGLGKTVQAISLMAALKGGILPARASKALPHLVVVPPSLLFNWEAEIARFSPDLRTHIYRGKDRSADFCGVDVVLTSYDLVRRDAARLTQIPFHVIVFDEAQAVKNPRAAVTGAVRRLQGVFKIALTGTPVENRMEDYWSVLDLAVPGLLGDYASFTRKEKDQSEGERIERIVRRTRPFVLRRSKAMIADELPPRTESDLYLELTAEQKALYTRTAEAARRTMDEAYRTQTAAQARITALAALMKLRRICLSPRLEGGAGKEPDPKVAALIEHLEELRDEGHSALVFSQFTTFLDLVEPELARRGFPLFRLDGSTPVGARKGLVNRFQSSDEPGVFLLSLKAGGRGLNLTRATYVFHLDPWWNPAVENQASDRAHRIGQTQKVTVVRLLMRHTVEEKMMVLKEKKLKLYEALLGGGAGGDAVIGRDEIAYLLEG